MSLSPVKHAVLENLLLNDKQAKPAQIAKETGNQLNSTMMHLIWLVRVGYANSPEKGTYAITEKGKKALGIPEITRENAKAILSPMPSEKAFHFYVGMEKPLEIYASGIQDFLEKIQTIALESLEFHANRGDFENWFECIGDCEVAKKMALLNEKKLSGEPLRERLREIVANRCTMLSTLVKETQLSG